MSKHKLTTAITLLVFGAITFASGFGLIYGATTGLITLGVVMMIYALGIFVSGV